MTPRTARSYAQADTRCAAPRRASLRAVLLATSALAAVALPTTIAQATDGTWLATQPADGDTGDFNNAGHWTAMPNGAQSPDGTATFNANVIHDIKFNDLTTLGAIAVTSGAGDYTFDTNGQNVTFNGAGLSVGSGASLAFTNSGFSVTDFVGKSTAGQAQIFITSGEVFFDDGSSADHAQIAVSGGAELEFSGNGHDNSSAANAKITTSGIVFFDGASTAANASIEIDAGGTVFFTGQTTAGHASINLLTGGALDISAHDTGIALDSLVGSGDIFLGSKNLTVGANGMSTTFSGAINDGASLAGIGFGFGGTGGSLTKVGNGALTLTSFDNSYTGATTVNGGALIVDGDIHLSSGVTVNAGGTLGGAGNVSSTTINAGGTLAPGHSDGTGGSLLVLGGLTFTLGATYLVQVSSAGANSTLVFGPTTLGGATVAANFAPGSTVTKQQYAILGTDNLLTDTFNPLVKSNLSPIFKTSEL